MYYVYYLYSQKRDCFYVGQTQDVGDRFIRHNKGYSKSTKNGVPWLLIYVEKFRTRSEAVQREYYVKSMKSREFIMKLTGYEP